MKKIVLPLLILTSTTIIAQDSVRINNNMDGRIAARDMRGATDPPALPVIETFLPQEATNSASGKYGKSLYSIKQLRVASGDSAFQVTLLDTSSGQTRLEWIGGDGAVVTSIYRVDTGEMVTDNQMNPNNNMSNRDTTTRNNVNNLNNTTGDTSMRNMNRDTSMRNMDNMNRDTPMRRDTMNMNRDTSTRNMPANTRDTTTRRDSIRPNGTSYSDLKYKRKEQGKPGEDLSILLSKLSNPMRFAGDMNFIRRRVSNIYNA